MQITKYRFHWQDAAGRLLKRWDNAAHHPEIVTNPNHVHEGSEENVRSHEPLSAEEVLAIMVASRLPLLHLCQPNKGSKSQVPGFSLPARTLFDGQAHLEALRGIVGK